MITALGLAAYKFSRTLITFSAGGRIHLVDHKYVRHADIGFAGMVGHLVTRAVRVGHHDRQVGLVEGEVIVSAVPQYDIHFLFSLAQNRS